MNYDTRTRHNPTPKNCGYIGSSKGFYIGDVTNALSPIDLSRMLANEKSCPTGLIRSCNGELIGVAYTSRNDCVFADNNGNRYPVDSGLLGIIPLELVSQAQPKKGLIVNESGAAWFGHNCDGMFNFILPLGTHLSIDTNEPIGH